MTVMWSKLKKSGARALAIVSLVSLAGCTTTPAGPDGPRPALWKLADEDTTIYLFGTIHILPEGLDWRTPTLEQAIAAAETLYLETEIGNDPMAAAQVMMKLGTAPGLPPLIERVPPEKREALAKMIASAGIPAGALDRMKTWAAALSLMAISFRQMGFSGDAGVEKGLAAGFTKPVKGLETVEQQLGFFNQLSEESQRALLASMAERPEEARAQFEAMLDAWKRGDTDDIARTFDNEKTLSPEMREILMTRRNAAWAQWMANRLEQPGTIMVAVGAGHLAGKGSVQEMLREKGLRAKRVQ